MSELSQDKPNGHTGLPAPARGLAHTDHPSRHWDRTCPACVAERGLSAVEEVHAAKKEGNFVLPVGSYYQNVVGIDLALRHAAPQIIKALRRLDAIEQAMDEFANERITQRITLRADEIEKAAGNGTPSERGCIRGTRSW